MLSTRDQFKAAFLHDCARRGLSLQETLETAVEAREKLASGVWEGITNTMTLQRYTEQAKVNKALKDYQGQVRRPGRPLM